jgi:hypothetical protein
MGYYLDKVKHHITRKLYPLTIQHLVYLVIITAVTFYVTGFFLQYRLLRWIYVGTMIVAVVTLYNAGDEDDAVDYAFKLVRI